MLIAGTIFAIVFWYIEAQWKSFQLISIQHADVIERFLNGAEDQLDSYSGPTIGAAYKNAFKFKHKVPRFLEAAWLANVWLPYLPLGILSLALYFAYKKGLLEISAGVPLQ